MKSLYIVSLILARSGSKGIVDKNIINYKNKPLIAHTIEQSLNSKYIEKTFVSTDSLKYQKIAIEYGAEAPFLRPAEISQDLSTDYEAFEHFINYLKSQNEKIPDIIVHLRTTYPSRSVKDIDRTVEIFSKKFDILDSLRSVVEAMHTPYKMWTLKQYILEPILNIKDVVEAYNEPRQNLPTVYWQNACIDIVKTSTIINKKSISGDSIYAYIMSKNEIHDIDELIDLERLNNQDLQG